MSKTKREYDKEYRERHRDEIREKAVRYSRARRKTVLGWITDTYTKMRRNSAVRGHPAPEFTKEELTQWLMLEPNLNKLYLDWVASGYDWWFKPSIDRINNGQGYAFGNIRLVTWKDNFDASIPYRRERMMGNEYAKGNKGSTRTRKSKD